MRPLPPEGAVVAGRRETARFLHGAKFNGDVCARGFLRDRKFRSTAVFATRASTRQNCVSRFDDPQEADEDVREEARARENARRKEG